MKKLIYLVAVFTLLISCNDSDDSPSLGNGNYYNSIWILNEGNFTKGNSTISVLKNGEIENRVFANKNNSNLGDTAQSLDFDRDFAYIVVNHSNKIEVVNRYTFESVRTITDDLQNPRYITISDGYAYVTNWGDGSNPNDDYVAVIDLRNYSSSKIPVAFGPEAILEEDGKIFVAHKGGFSQNNIITVIDENTKRVIKTIEVGDMPDSMVEEDGYLYVLSNGKPAYTNAETNGAIHKIDTRDLTVKYSVPFLGNKHPKFLREDDGKMYFILDKSIYNLRDSGVGLNYTKLFDFTESAYGFNVEDDRFYISDGKEFTSNGSIYIHNSNGQVLNEYSVGVGPNGFYWND